MLSTRCLLCYQELGASETDFHAKCSKSFFGKPVPPVLEYSFDQMQDLAAQVIQTQVTIPGVQAKLSLGLKSGDTKAQPQKLTLVGVLGNYILKPPSRSYRCLPELEDLSMHMAEDAGIHTVPHTLIRLASGELCYLTKRIDRDGDTMYHMEDMCQLTGRLTEAKYRGSYEQIAKTILQYSTDPVLDAIAFFEQLVFSYLTGNNDMHMKNFSLFKDPQRGYVLSPAYDLLASALVVEKDTEELALTLSGKKRKLKRLDFEKAMLAFRLDKRMIENLFTRLARSVSRWHERIELGFLPSDLAEMYHELIDARASKLAL